MFRVHMAAAGHGDCLWLEYGDPARPRRILVDGGIAGTYPRLRARLLEIPPADRELELLVVSHVDADHIEGIVALLADTSLDLRVRDVWFNGWDHLHDEPELSFGAVQGEYLSALIGRRGFAWNAATGGRALVVPDAGPLPTFTLDGGLALTLLSPTRRTLARMAGVWDDEVRRAGLTPGAPAPALEHLEHLGKRLLSFSGPEPLDVPALAAAPFRPDASAANGSSIAFLAEHAGRSCLLAADAHADVLTAGLRRLLAARGLTHLALDAFKLPHHGSKANLDPSLLDLVRSRHVLVSTDGHRFHHPDDEALARLLVRRWGCTLHFNYRSDETAAWDDPTLKAAHAYATHYPQTDDAGVTLDLA